MNPNPVLEEAEESPALGASLNPTFPSPQTSSLPSHNPQAVLLALLDRKIDECKKRKRALEDFRELVERDEMVAAMMADPSILNLWAQ